MDRDKAPVAANRLRGQHTSGPWLLGRPEIAGMAVAALRQEARQSGGCQRHPWVVLSDHVPSWAIARQSPPKRFTDDPHGTPGSRGRFWRKASDDRVV